jgi:hypothetical protein
MRDFDMLSAPASSPAQMTPEGTESSLRRSQLKVKLWPSRPNAPIGLALAAMTGFKTEIDKDGWRLCYRGRSEKNARNENAGHTGMKLDHTRLILITIGFTVGFAAVEAASMLESNPVPKSVPVAKQTVLARRI